MYIIITTHEEYLKYAPVSSDSVDRWQPSQQCSTSHHHHVHVRRPPLPQRTSLNWSTFRCPDFLTPQLRYDLFSDKVYSEDLNIIVGLMKLYHIHKLYNLAYISCITWLVRLGFVVKTLIVPAHSQSHYIH